MKSTKMSPWSAAAHLLRLPGRPLALDDFLTHAAVLGCRLLARSLLWHRTAAAVESVQLVWSVLAKYLAVTVWIDQVKALRTMADP